VPADTVPEAMTKVAYSVFQASILRDRHEDEHCCNQEALWSSPTRFISSVHGLVPHL